MLSRHRLRFILLLVVSAGATPLRAAVYVPADRLWTNNVVPFVWDPAVPFPNRLRVVAAMNVIEEVANITFELQTNETDYVYIQNAPGDTGSRSPTIGRGGNEQDLFIRQDLSDITTFGLAHELGHVLGLYHTHQRPDRNAYVTYYSGRVNDCRAGNFTVASDSLGYPRNAMDYDSVMSYGECIFSNCGLTFDSTCSCDDQSCNRWTSNDCDLLSVTCCSENPSACRVIEIDDPIERAQWQALLGQRDHFSYIDAITLSFMYPQGHWRFLERNYAGTSNTGTFHDPYEDLTTALDEAPTGAVLWIQPAGYNAPGPAGVMNKAMLLRAPLGGVVIR